MKNRNVSKLQIQPVYAARHFWEAIAGEWNLNFEALELSTGPALTGRLQEGCLEWYRKSGRVNSVHGVFIDVNPVSGDEDIRILSQRRCHQSCELAKDLGAGNVVFHSSCEPFLRGAYLDQWAGNCASFLEMLSDRYDLRIWIENSQDVDSGPIKELMRRITDKRVGVCLDLGHANYSRMPIECWFEELGEWIGYLHLSDNNGLYDDHLPLGRGKIDWDAADKLWQGLGRETYLTLEVGGEDGLRESLVFLKAHGLFGMSQSGISK